MKMLDDIAFENANLIEKLSGIGYWKFDVKNRKFYYSQQMCQILGVKKTASNLKKYLPLKDYKKLIANFGRLLRYGEKNTQDVKFIRSDKSVIYCRVNACLIKEKNIICGTLQDITEFVNIKAQLIKARNEAENLSREKSFFLAQASHDLRQPLYALKLYLDLLQPKNFTKQQWKLWENINKSSDSLKYLLENVLDLSKLDYGGTKVFKTNFNIGMLISDLGREFKHTAECQDLTLEYVICNCLVCSDAFLVERILRNLLSNAFKFADKKVSMFCHEHKQKLIVEVKDDGIGIAPQDKKYIFDAFYQGQNVRDNNIEGMGLGLTIVKRIATVLHIKISVTSKPNKGTSFKLFLPKAAVKH